MNYIKKFESIFGNNLSKTDVDDIQDLFLGFKEKHDIIETKHTINDHFRIVNVMGKPSIYYNFDTLRTLRKGEVIILKISWSRIINDDQPNRKHSKVSFESDLRDFIKNLKDRYDIIENTPSNYSDVTILCTIRIENKKPLSTNESLTKWLIDNKTKDIPSVENIDYCFHDDTIFSDVKSKPMIVDLSDYEKMDDKYVLKNNIYGLPRYNPNNPKSVLKLLDLDPSEDLIVGYQVVVTFDKEYHHNDVEISEYVSNVRKKLNQIDCDILIYHNEIFSDEGKDYIFAVLTKNKLVYDRKYLS